MGFASSSGATNQREQQIAIALVNAQQRWVLPDGTTFELLDYQVPLKSRRADGGIGKIDLLGLSDTGRIVVVELKVVGHRGGTGDLPRTALMEALRYGAIVEANQPRMAREIRERFGRAVSDARPALIVLGEQGWWDAWADWRQPIWMLARRVGAALGLNIHLGTLSDCAVSYGSGDVAPWLQHLPQLGYEDADPPRPATAAAYEDDLTAHWWGYATKSAVALLCFTRRPGPPVLQRKHEGANLILPACEETAAAIRCAIAQEKRHRHFGSFRSSQALTQSVFGGLAACGHLDVLGRIPAECGRPAFMDGGQARFEVNVNSLGEPRPTNLDVLLERGDYRVAVECKFTEAEFGTCSRVTGKAPLCNGSYTRQLGRSSRCALTEIGVTYWEHAARVFTWPHDGDIDDCPLRSTYQVARNAFAVASERPGHAVVVYDARNPAYGPGGKADDQWRAAAGACRVPGLLRRVTWQRIATAVAGERDLVGWPPVWQKSTASRRADPAVQHARGPGARRHRQPGKRFNDEAVEDCRRPFLPSGYRTGSRSQKTKAAAWEPQHFTCRDRQSSVMSGCHYLPLSASR